MKMSRFLPFVLFLAFISCGKEDNEKFTGIYKGDVNCLNEGGPYATTITISVVNNTTDQVSIKLESDGDSSNLNGTVSGDVLTIPSQTIGG